MEIEQKQAPLEVQFKREDGTFVAIVNGYPYHVTHDDPLFPEAKKAGRKAPLEKPPEPPSVKERRLTTSVSRRDFCMGLFRAGILKPEDAISASKGNWPEAMADFLGYLSEDQSTDAEIEWASAVTISRSHPMVLTLGSFVGLSEEALDGVFGIE